MKVWTTDLIEVMSDQVWPDSRRFVSKKDDFSIQALR